MKIIEPSVEIIDTLDYNAMLRKVAGMLYDQVSTQLPAFFEDISREG